MKPNLHMLAASLAVGSAMAHIEMKSPYPFRSRFNPDEKNVDYSNTSPLAADGELITPTTIPFSSELEIIGLYQRLLQGQISRARDTRTMPCHRQLNTLLARVPTLSSLVLPRTAVARVRSP